MNVYYLVSQIPTQDKKNMFSIIAFYNKILYLYSEITKNNSLDDYACLMQSKAFLETEFTTCKQKQQIA